jgi:hypothetical protein
MIMEMLVAFTYRYLSPFLAGVCVAGASVVSGVPAMIALLLAAALFGFISLPAGDRVIRRIVGVAT